MLKRSLRFIGKAIMFGCLVAIGAPAIAQVSITNGSPVTQNFDGVGTSATTTLPSGFRVSRTSATFSGAGTTTELAAGTSGAGAVNGSSSGGTYNWANGVTASSTDRAVGFLTSTSASGPGYIFMQLQNNTGVTITDLALTFDYEKYRSGTRAFDMTMQTSTDGTTFGSNIASATQSYAADANNTTVSNPPAGTTKNVTLSGVNIANGASYYIRWTYAPNSGAVYSNAQGLGVDNISVTATIGCSGTPAHATSSATASAVCSGGTTSLSLSGYTSGMGITYQWQSSASGAVGTYANIAGATNTSYTTGALVAASYYRCVTRCTNSGLADTSTVSGVSINAIPNPSISGTATIFTGNSTTLLFSGAASDVVYYWNGASTLNTTLGAGGSSTVTVTPTVTTTYSVTSATSALGCTANITGKAAWVIVMSPSDTIPARDNNLYMGNPSNATSNASDSNNYLMAKAQYTLSYNNRKGMANWVSWHLSRAWKGAATRCNCFTQDGTLPTGYYKAITGDYTNTGFDRGHLCPSDDRDYSDTDNSATFKMTNMSPQAPFLNEQVWANFEDYCRKLMYQGNELYIIAGGYGTGGTGNLGGTTSTIASGAINVPSHFWKVVLVLPVGANDSTRVHYNSRIIAIDMPNVQSVNAKTWDYYRVSVDTIEARTGYNFFSNVPDSIENIIEARIDNGAAGILYWDLTGVSSPATMLATGIADKLDTSTASAYNTLTRGSTAGASSAANSFRTAGFKNDGISTANTDYFQVKVKAKSGYRLSISGIDCRFAGTSSFYASPGITSQFAYSLNGSTFTLIGSPVISTSTTPPTFDCSGVSALQNIADTQTVYLRYYASGQTTTGGWGFYSSDTGVNGMIINGALVATGAKPGNTQPQVLQVKTNLEVTIAPNPFDNDLRFTYSSEEQGGVTIYIYNLYGQMVYTTRFSDATGEAMLPLGDLPSGHYVLAAVAGDSKVVKRIVKR